MDKPSRRLHDHLHNQKLPTLQLHRSIIVMVSHAIIIMVHATIDFKGTDIVLHFNLIHSHMHVQGLVPRPSARGRPGYEG